LYHFTTIVLEVKAMKEETPVESCGLARSEDLQFPPANLSHFQSGELVGYYSYVNWLVPELTLGPWLKLSLLLFDKIVAESGWADDPEMTYCYLFEL